MTKKNDKKKNKAPSKASALKLLRKQFEKANKLSYDLPVPMVTGADGDDEAVTGTDGSVTQQDVSAWLKYRSTRSHEDTLSTKGEKEDCQDVSKVSEKDHIENIENGISKMTTVSSSTSSTKSTSTSDIDNTSSLKSEKMMLFSYSSSEIVAHGLIHKCLDLFRQNMSTLYEKSSWGLDLESKRDELSHHRARYLVLVTGDNAGGEKESTEQQQQQQQQQPQQLLQQLVGFCHYRWEYDDEEEPTTVVLYIYEIQIAQQFRRLGLGGHLMSVIEELVRQQRQQMDHDVTKVMLTVFKANQSAMRFYLDKLHYQIDETSPSRHGMLSEDYEILSKTIQQC